MKSSLFVRSVVSSVLISFLTQTIALAAGDFPEFDRGPDPQDPMQQELVEILQDMPFLPGISEQLHVLTPSGRGQKMRPDFGAMPLRGFLKPNSISVLVIGQDGTHIAEGANRPGIAGFGGRVQDMLLHFGILEGVFFTNLYVNTISGQYGSRSTPVVKDGKTIQFQNVIENRQWLLTHEGPYGQWRNRFLSWVIRNNLDSLRMVMMLGQAGKDAGANLVNYLGGSVKQRESIGSGEQFDVPVFKMTGAGGNNEFAVALTEKGEDVAEIMRKDSRMRGELLKALNEGLARAKEEAASATSAGAKKRAEAMVGVWNARIQSANKGFNYRDADRNTTEPVSVFNAEFLMTKFPKEAIELMAFTNGGPVGNGVLHPQQFGGWDLGTMTVNGKKTRSIKGLKIPCAGSRVGPCSGSSFVTAPDIVFVGAPHPTSLSMNEMTRPGSAAISVEKELIAPLKSELARGWKAPKPEEGLTSPFMKGQPYKYGRGVIPPSHGDPGITAMRLLPVSTAQRDGSSMIIIGTRDGVKFDTSKIEQMEKDKPSNPSLMNSRNVLTGRPKFTEWLYAYDRGPNQKYSDLLFKSLDKKSVLMPKSEYKSDFDAAYNSALAKAKERASRAGRQVDQDDLDECYLAGNNAVFAKVGIDGFNFKSHPEASFFGHYRGTFEKPQVVILADPHGYDSFITSKAASGARGQYLNGLMQDLGVKDQYLVLSTVPMMMDGATSEEWKAVLKSTEDYRKNLLSEVFKDSKPKLILADGAYAASELKRLGYSGFVEIKQSADPSVGIKEAGKLIVQNPAFKTARVSGARIDIPRSHLTWIARTWEGTSGDRVITATDKGNKGKAYAIVAPNWARMAKTLFTSADQESIEEMIVRLAKNGEPMPYENVIDFVKRRENCATAFERSQGINKSECTLTMPVNFTGTLRDAGSF